MLNALENSARFSHDFDIFHELAEGVTSASNRDVEDLRRAGFHVETPSRYGEWEKDAAGKPGWIGDDPSLRLHAPSVRGCWPTVHGLEP